MRICPKCGRKIPKGTKHRCGIKPRVVKKAMSNYTFSFKLNSKKRQKTVRAGDIYDGGQKIKKLYPKATNLKLK